MKSLFNGWEETLIYSCLDGTMGSVYGNSESAVCVLGDFFFYAGKPSEDLLRYVPVGYENKTVIACAKTEDWHPFIEKVYPHALKGERYAIKKEGDCFNREYLESIVYQLNSRYELKKIDEDLYYQCKAHPQFCDFVSNYLTYEKYNDCGLGYVILDDEKIIAGASSYASYRGGIEIEIDTDKAYRQQGLASMCGAKLILECLNRELYPSWDAQNMISVHLAKKLGYHLSHAYPIYEICFQDK